MNTYWLYLEPHTVVFQDSETFLLYNTLSGDNEHIQKGTPESELIERLISTPDVYLLQINEDELMHDNIVTFIRKLRDVFIAEQIDCRLTTNKPMILYPKLRLFESVENVQADYKSSIGDNILQYLQKVTIQITDNCGLLCNSCDLACRLLTTCTKRGSAKELSINEIEEILRITQNSSTSIVNIIGGDIFLYHNFKQLCELMNRYNKLTYDLYCRDNHLIDSIKSNLSLLKDTKNCKLIIQFDGIAMENQIRKVLEKTNELNLNISIQFIIYSEREYHDIENECKKIGIKSYEIYLNVQKDTDQTMLENLYIDRDDIFSSVHSKKDIFRRKSLNTNDFGCITIFANKDVYANINRPLLGNLKEKDILTLLYKEITEGESWLSVRDKYPCNNCIYQWLCPSPSNYELIIGKSNLCNIKSD